ncbi:MAG: LamG-like jellyroll fold domain-containing protein, partial [Candidatus Methanoperedens sp.]|nr:LamG-like jellyroll fold domain-containing protein [Candidatus Methanoperedens sp.]
MIKKNTFWYLSTLSILVLVIAFSFQVAATPIIVNDHSAKDLRTLDDKFNEVSGIVPEFGGMFLEGDALKVYLIKPEKKLAAQEAIISVFGRERVPGGGVKVLQGEYTFTELKEWQGQMGGLFNIPGVVFTDVDESSNRLKIGVESSNLTGVVEEEMKKQGIPNGAYIIEQTEPIVFASTLVDNIRPLQGGIQITFSNNPNYYYACTLGLNGVRSGVNGFVVNSHCTYNQGGVDSTSYYQSLIATGNHIGTEIADPSYFNCGGGNQCRYSDSAFAARDPGVTADLGFIKKPDSVNTNSLTIAGNFRIVSEGSSLVGQTLNKVGRTTGWTQGQVTSTCVNTGVSRTRIVQLCQDFVSAGVDSGDSGSPVFNITNGNDVELRGILWGSSGTTSFVYSPIANIERSDELGLISTTALPQYTLSAPVNLTSRQANFWINYTWAAGPGNKTDSYNVSVNNSWTNGSTRNYSNNSNLAPHGWSNITVRAYNNSGSLSAPVSNNTQLANNIPNQTITGGQTITLSGGQSFTFTGGHTVTFTGGHSITFTVNATDADFDPITYSTDAAKGSLNSITGVYYWATSLLDVGTYIWSFRSSDTYGGIDSDLVTLNVVGPTYIPPTPSALTPHQNNFWVNYTWSAGSGPNITNSYNVSHNTGWSNNTIPFRNNTVGPHGWSNISVYAYNNSGTGQLNLTPAIMNTQVANNVPVLGTIGPRTVTVGQLLTFTISATDADSDTLTNATNASKGTFIPSTGVFTWTPGDSDVGTYLWSFNTSDLYGGVDSETISMTVNSAPAIIGYAPPSPVYDSQGAARVFNVTVSQTVNVTWYINGTEVGFNGSVTSANYTNTSAAVGMWNVSAVAVNDNGSAMQTWVWDVSNLAGIPSISFTYPTPADSSTLTENFVFINTSITNSTNTTAFIDWNGSLTGWWRFNGESGESSTFFRDWSSRGNNNGTCSGSTCPVSASGKFGNGLSFDGVNDYITAGNNVTITAPYSIEGWVKIPANSGSANKNIISLGTTSSGYPKFSPHKGTTNKPMIYLNASNYRYGSTNLADNNWHHIAFIVMGTNAADIL